MHASDGSDGENILDIDQRCQKCRQPLIGQVKGRCSGLYCPYCQEWAVVTSHFSPVEEDSTNYTLVLTLKAVPEPAILKKVSQLLQLNYLQLREKVINGESLTYSTNATTILNILNDLKLDNAQYNIEPEFPYTSLLKTQRTDD